CVAEARAPVEDAASTAGPHDRAAAPQHREMVCHGPRGTAEDGRDDGRVGDLARWRVAPPHSYASSVIPAPRRRGLRMSGGGECSTAFARHVCRRAVPVYLVSRARANIRSRRIAQPEEWRFIMPSASQRALLRISTGGRHNRRIASYTLNQDAVVHAKRLIDA